MDGATADRGTSKDFCKVADGSDDSGLWGLGFGDGPPGRPTHVLTF